MGENFAKEKEGCRWESPGLHPFRILIIGAVISYFILRQLYRSFPRFKSVYSLGFGEEKSYSFSLHEERVPEDRLIWFSFVVQSFRVLPSPSSHFQ